MAKNDERRTTRRKSQTRKREEANKQASVTTKARNLTRAAKIQNVTKTKHRNENLPLEQPQEPVQRVPVQQPVQQRVMDQELAPPELAAKAKQGQRRLRPWVLVAVKKLQETFMVTQPNSVKLTMRWLKLWYLKQKAVKHHANSAQ